MLHGKFIVNDADYSPFSLDGVGTFMAHSGTGVYRNHGGCSAIPDNGPIPPGKYWIVDRGEGGLMGKANAYVRDTINTTFSECSDVMDAPS